jgi:hypothetical protein
MVHGFCTKCDYSTLEKKDVDGIADEVIRSAGDCRSLGYHPLIKYVSLKCPVCGQALKVAN